MYKRNNMIWKQPQIINIRKIKCQDISPLKHGSNREESPKVFLLRKFLIKKGFLVLETRRLQQQEAVENCYPTIQYFSSTSYPFMLFSVFDSFLWYTKVAAWDKMD